MVGDLLSFLLAMNVHYKRPETLPPQTTDFIIIKIRFFSHNCLRKINKFINDNWKAEVETRGDEYGQREERKQTLALEASRR